jgi:hypothetical protein
MRAHALYICVGAACGATALAAVSQRVLGGPWLIWGAVGSAAIPLSLSLGLGAWFQGRPALRRLQDLLAKLPWPAVRARVERWRSGATHVDGNVARVGSARAATWRAAAAFFGGWLVESLETAIVIRLVGGPLDLGMAMAVEVGITMVRSIGNIAPAGLGVQDAGYAVLLEAMGLPSHTTAAFVLLKRAKELAWIAVGYGLLAMMRRAGSRAEAQVAPVVVETDSARLGRVAGAAPVRTLLGEARRAAPRQPAV